MNIEHDKDLPYAVVNKVDEALVARFADQGDAEAFADPWCKVVNTSPLPTKRGVYALSTDATGSRHLVLANGGKWYWLDFTGRKQDQVLEETNAEVAARYAATMAPKWVEA